MLTEASWYQGELGICVPHCSGGNHGECSDGDCRCSRPECRAYRDEWYVTAPTPSGSIGDEQ